MYYEQQHELMQNTSKSHVHVRGRNDGHRAMHDTIKSTLNCQCHVHANAATYRRLTYKSPCLMHALAMQFACAWQGKKDNQIKSASSMQI